MRSIMRNIPITNLEQLAEDLRQLRRQRGSSQQQLAERALLSRRTVTNAESGENVGLKEFTRLVNALGYEVVLRPRNTVVFEELAEMFKDE